MNALRGEEIEMKRRHGPGRKWALEQSEEDEVRERGSSKILWVLSFILRGERENDSVMPNSLRPHGLYSPWNSPGQNTGVGLLSFLGNFPNPGIKPRSPILQADSLLTEPQGKPRNTGVGSLSLPQRVFLTQKSNRGLLLCRWILYWTIILRGVVVKPHQKVLSSRIIIWQAYVLKRSLWQLCGQWLMRRGRGGLEKMEAGRKQQRIFVIVDRDLDQGLKTEVVRSKLIGNISSVYMCVCGYRR